MALQGPSLSLETGKAILSLREREEVLLRKVSILFRVVLYLELTKPHPEAGELKTKCPNSLKPFHSREGIFSPAAFYLFTEK